MNARRCTWFVVSIVGLLSLSSTAHAILVSRLSGQAIYDTDLNITWLANANLALTETFGLPTQHDYVGASPEYIDTRFGTTTYTIATDYVTRMNAYNDGSGYLGVNAWRLPWTPQIDPTCRGSDPINGYDGCTGSELGHLFLVEFGGSLNDPAAALFSNLTGGLYWSGSVDSENSLRAWATFASSSIGTQVSWYWYDSARILPVADGDVFAAPVPAAGYLLLSGLISLGCAGRLRSRYCE